MASEEDIARKKENERVSEALFQAEVDCRSRHFASISIERRAVLDRLCEAPKTWAEAEEEAEEEMGRNWEEYERELQTVSEAEKGRLFEKYFTPWPEQSDPPPLADWFKASVEEGARNELEREYVAWRSDYNMRRRNEALGKMAVELKSIDQARLAELSEKHEESRELARGQIDFLAQLRQKMTKKDADLFFLLLGNDSQGHPLTFEEVGKRCGGITKQAVSKRVEVFRARHLHAWALVETYRNKRKPVVFSEQAPSVRRREGVGESGYDYDDD